jgi:transcriptional regulator with XRE-family HTH domain
MAVLAGPFLYLGAVYTIPGFVSILLGKFLIRFLGTATREVSVSKYGERLRDLRAERQLSLREVEERGGPNKDTMSLVERGVHRPHAQTLGRIAKAFGMSVAELRVELETPPSLAEWLEERCGHAYLALPKGEFEEMFDRMAEDAPERRERALEVNREYNTFCKFPNNAAPTERIAMRKMIRDAIPEVAVKHGIALREGDLDREYQEEAARIFDVERATESATA